MRKRIVSFLLSVAMCLCLLPGRVDAAYFRDVGAHWARSYIEDAVDMGLFNGTSPDRFEPEAAMTRAMFVTVLYRMDGGEAETSTRYTDVRPGDWYADAVAWASENGIVTGTSTYRFSPNENVTREQMVTILDRYLSAADAELVPETEAASISFRDSANIAPYAWASVQKMQRANIVSGKPDGSGYRFDPKGRATRAEVACIMCRFLDALSYNWEEEEPDPEQAYEQMNEVTQSSELQNLSNRFKNASSDSQKESIVEQAISYFEQQEEDGMIDYCDVDRENKVISYEIDGCEFAYFLYDVSSEGITDGTRSPLIDTSSQYVASSLTISPNIVSCASNLVGAASSNKKALILDYYSASSSDPYASHFHKFSQKAEERYKAVGYTPKTIYGFTIADLQSGLEQYNLMLFNTHGALINNTPVVCLSEAVTSKNRANYKTDIKDGNVIIATSINTKTYEYCIAPQFFTAHYQYLNTSWIHLDLCKGFGGNNELVETLSSLNVNNITGFGDTVPSYFADYCFTNLLDYMADQYQLKDCIDYADTAARKQYRALGDKNSSYLVCPKLQLYGKGWLKLTEVEDHYGRIRIALNPDVGTITGGTYSLYCVRSDLTEELLYDGKSFTTSAFEITGLQDTLHYRIVIKVPNYDSAEAKIMAVEYPKDTNIPITYNPSKPLDPVVSYVETEVTVEDLDGKTLSNASVTLYGQKNGENFTKLTSGTTDSSGHFTVSKVEHSYQTLKAEASKTGYISGSTEKSFAGQGKNKRYITVTLDTEKSLEPDDTSTDLPSADSDGWTRVYNGEQLTKALEADRDILLMADVKDVKGISNYKGTFDGNKHTITNPLGYDGTHTTSWILHLYGTVKNVNFASIDFSFSPSIWEAQGLICNNYGHVERCVIRSGSMTMQNTPGTMISEYRLAALVGDNRGTIRDCVNMADVVVSNNCVRYAYAAGIAANSQKDSDITHCLNTGNISCKSVSNTDGENFYSYSAGICYTAYPVVSECGNTRYFTSGYSISPELSSCYTVYKTNRDALLPSYCPLYTYSERDILSMWSDVLN